MSQYKAKTLQTYNLNNFCFVTQSCSMGCKDTVLPEPLLRNGNVNCLTFEKKTIKLYKDNLCLFRALALHLSLTLT